MSAPVTSNVIPFAKPRAMAGMQPTFSNGPATGGPYGTAASGPYAAPTVSWGSTAAAPAPQIAAPTWGSTALAAAPALPQRMPHATPAPPIANPQVKPAPAAMAVAAMATPGQMAAVQPTIAPTPRAPTNSNQSFTTLAAANAKAGKWKVFEQLGLGAPKLDHKKLSGHLVTAYRLLGFIILSIIVVVLIGYLVTTAFFYMSNTWVVPIALSPSDEKIVSLQAQLSERQTARDRTAADLDQAERAIAVQAEFQTEFAKAIKSDLDGRKAALARMYELAAVAASTRRQIKKSNSAYASASQKRMAEEWRAGLIDRNEMINGKFQIAQISSSNLSLAERQAEYETRAADLDQQTRALEALLAGGTATDGSLSYDVLKIKQEFEASRLETKRAIDTRDMLKTALEREDKIVASLKQSSYIKAMADGAHVAFVPYGNLENIKKGAPLYGCWLTMVFCKKVGVVLEVLPGEVQFKHPNRDKQMRGQVLELKLDKATSATDDVLFVGGRPLFI